MSVRQVTSDDALARDLQAIVEKLNRIPAQAVTHLVAHGWDESDPWKAGGSGISINEALTRGNFGSHGSEANGCDFYSGANVWALVLSDLGWRARARKCPDVESLASFIQSWSLTVDNLIATFGQDALFILDLIEEFHPGRFPWEYIDNESEVEHVVKGVTVLLTDLAGQLKWLPELLAKAWDEAGRFAWLLPTAKPDGESVPRAFHLAIAGVIYAQEHRDSLSDIEFDALTYPTWWDVDEASNQIETLIIDNDNLLEDEGPRAVGYFSAPLQLLQESVNEYQQTESGHPSYAAHTVAEVRGAFLHAETATRTRSSASKPPRTPLK